MIGVFMRLNLVLLLGFALMVSGCAQPQTSGTSTTLENGEPSDITVQHCLIGFESSIPGKKIVRSKEAAAELASSLLEKAKSGENFDDIVTAYTDDSPPGIYEMVNSGLPAGAGKYSRDKMVPAFGNVGFKLEVGEYGMSVHHSRSSPYGWHIIKRLK